MIIHKTRNNTKSRFIYIVRTLISGFSSDILFAALAFFSVGGIFSGKCRPAFLGIVFTNGTCVLCTIKSSMICSLNCNI